MHEYLVGLNVTDEDGYQKYRQGMAPILKAHGGGFRYDLRVAEVLISQTKDVINRVFTIYFPDKESSRKFFANPDYIKIKKTYFEQSVQSTTIMAEYKR